MNPDWNPEMADDALRKLEGRNAPSRPAFRPALVDEQDERPAFLLSRNVRLAFSGAALLLGLIFTSLRAVSRDGFTLVGGCALLCAVIGVALLDQTLPGRRPTRAGSMRPMALTRGPRRALLGALAMGTLLTFFWLAQSFAHLDGGVHIPFVDCAAHALLTGLVVLMALIWIWRKTDPFSPALTGALLGANSGIVGALAVTFVCTNREGFHLLLGHGLSTTGLAVLGAWLGRRLLSP